MVHLNKPVCVRFSTAEWKALEARRRKSNVRSLSEMVRILCGEAMRQERLDQLEERVYRLERRLDTW